MTHTAKHTPTGEVMAHFNLSDEEWDGLPSFMQQKLATVYCQHAAAPAMYEALCSIPDHALDCKHSYPHTLACWNCIVKAALAQAEGR